MAKKKYLNDTSLKIMFESYKFDVDCSEELLVFSQFIFISESVWIYSELKLKEGKKS
jgi:hypothetical protein